MIETGRGWLVHAMVLSQYMELYETGGTVTLDQVELSFSDLASFGQNRAIAFLEIRSMFSAIRCSGGYNLVDQIRLCTLLDRRTQMRDEAKKDLISAMTIYSGALKVLVSQLEEN